MNIVYYQDFSEIVRLVNNSNKKFLVIGPGPGMVDQFRSLMAGKVDWKKFEVITISHFMNRYLKKLRMKLESPMRKVELFVDLAKIWRQEFGEDFYQFSHSFELFTDLRSSCLDIELIKELQPEFGEELFRPVLLFFEYCSHLNIVDEHMAYNQCTQYLERQSVEIEQNILVWGFGHLTLEQINMFKGFSRFTEVFIPLEEIFKNNLTSSDWPTWCEENLLDGKGPKNLNCDSLKVYRYFGNSYTGLLENRELNNIVLVDEKLGPSHISQIPLSGITFSMDINFWGGIINQFIESLRSKSGGTQGRVNLDVIEEYISTEYKKEVARPFHLKSFKYIKVLDMGLEELRELKNSQLVAKDLGPFELNLLKYLMELKTSRVQFFSASATQDEEVKLFSFKNWPYLSNENLFLAARTFTTPEKFRPPKYSSKVMSWMQAVGPVKGQSVDYYQKMNSIVSCLKQGNGVLALENQIEEENSFWSELLDHFKKIEWIELKEGCENSKQFSIGNRVCEKEKPESFSPTQIQTYIDCPRKYYFTYLDKVGALVESDLDLTNRLKGVIQHSVIEQYLTGFDKFSEKAFLKVVDDVVIHQTKRKKLSDQILRKCTQEMIATTRPAITDLIKMKKSGVTFSFEETLRDPQLKFLGRADCLFKWNDFWGVIDFKRSSSSTPTHSEMSNLKKIQVMSYLHCLNLDKRQIAFVGHINLAELRESTFYSFNNDFQKFLKSIDLKMNKGIRASKDNLDTLLGRIDAKLSSSIENVNNDKEFEPTPGSSHCRFCPINNHCEVAQIG